MGRRRSHSMSRLSPNMEAKKREQIRVTTMVNRARGAYKGKSVKPFKQPEQGSQWVGPKPKSSAPKTFIYPVAPKLFQPTHLLSRETFVVAVKVNLKVVSLPKLEQRVYEGYDGRLRGIPGTPHKVGKQVIELKPEQILFVEYNPLSWPSRKGNGKIHVQTADGMHRIGLTDKSRQEFVGFIQRIHANPLKEPGKLLPDFEVTIAEAKPQKA